MGCRGLSISLRSITAADRALPARTIIPFPDWYVLKDESSDTWQSTQFLFPEQ